MKPTTTIQHIGASEGIMHPRNQTRLWAALRRMVMVLANAGTLILLCMMCRSVNGQSIAQEYQVKAVFLSKFASFVSWPDAAFPDGGSPIVIGILGADPFGRYLEEAIQGETINGRPLKIKRIQKSDEGTGCHIVFIREKDQGRLAQILEPLKGEPVLTVGETNQFTRRGGIVNFAMSDGRVRIEFNPDEADRSGLKVSAKLLSVSTIVK